MRTCIDYNISRRSGDAVIMGVMELQEFMGLSYFQIPRIILTAAELDLFQHLSERATAKDVASACGYDPYYTERLLNALVAIGALTKSDGRFEIPASLKEALGNGTKSVVPMLKHRARLWRSWSSLSDIVRNGRGFYELNPDINDHKDHQSTFIKAMAAAGNRLASQAASVLVSEAASMGLDVKSVLDVGGGPGIYAIEFAKAFPEAKVFILDLPGAPDVASEFVSEAGLEDRIGFIEGSALEVTADYVRSVSGFESFDIIFSSSLSHSFSMDDIRGLMRNKLEWSGSPGLVVVKDFYVDDDRVSPQRAAIFDINMMVNTMAGKSYSWSEMESITKGVYRGTRPLGLGRSVLDDGYSGLFIVRK